MGGGWRIEEERIGRKGGMTVIGVSTGQRYGGEGKRRGAGGEEIKKEGENHKYLSGSRS